MSRHRGFGACTVVTRSDVDDGRTNRSRVAEHGAIRNIRAHFDHKREGGAAGIGEERIADRDRTCVSHSRSHGIPAHRCAERNKGRPGWQGVADRYIFRIERAVVSNLDRVGQFRAGNNRIRAVGHAQLKVGAALRKGGGGGAVVGCVWIGGRGNRRRSGGEDRIIDDVEIDLGDHGEIRGGARIQ